MRGRVAITPSSQLHVGHARTTLLGSLICEKMGIPYVVRVDGAETVAIDVMCEIHDMLRYLEVEAEVVCMMRAIPPRDSLIPILGDRVDDVLLALKSPAMPVNAAMLLDDVMHHPSVIIRGVEFKDPGYFPEAGVGTAQHVLLEDSVFSAAGLEKQEISLPHINVGIRKMSKSTATGLTWKIFEMVPKDLGREFLVASAMHPEDPLSNLGCRFDLDKMPMVPYYWSWENWTQLVRRY